MVVPLAAVAGRALMSAGARIGGSQMARAAGGQALKTGAVEMFKTSSGKRVAMDIASSLMINKRTLKAVEKSAGLLSLYSPMFKQQTKIMWQGIALPLRAIGDWFGKLIRPWAMISMRVGLEIYKLLSALGGASGAVAKFSSQSIDDRLKQLGDELISAQLAGDSSLETAIQAQIDALNARTPSGSITPLDLSGITVGLFDNLFSTISANLNLDAVISAIEDLGDYISDLYEDTLDDFDSIMAKIIDFLTPDATTDETTDETTDGTSGNWATRIWDNYIAPMWTGLVSWATKIWDNYIAPTWTGLVSWATKIWDEYIAPMWTDVVNWATRIWDEYLKPAWTSVVDKLKEIITWLNNLLPKPPNPIAIGEAGGRAQKETGSFWEGIKAAGKEFFYGGMEEITGTSATGGVAAKKSGVNDLWSKYMQIQGGRGEYSETEVDYSSNAATKMAKQIAADMFRYNNPLQKATGGDINETGMYGLHAGEKVITASENSKDNRGQEFNFSNKIIINNPQISNRFDIKMLARELAKYQERELRRRVSYV